MGKHLVTLGIVWVVICLVFGIVFVLVGGDSDGSASLHHPSRTQAVNKRPQVNNKPKASSKAEVYTRVHIAGTPDEDDTLFRVNLTQ